jgi:pimeloyl-ACP methyl ester carboxylesterase
MWSESAQGILSSVSEPDFLRAEDLAGLRVPVRLVWGARDRLLPEGTLQFFRSGLPNADVVLLERAGHLPHLEAPFALARALVQPLTI